jgi:hypothetical protein
MIVAPRSLSYFGVGTNSRRAAVEDCGSYEDTSDAFIPDT